MADPVEFEPKPLSKAGIEGALDKCERYRLLNEPGDAESIARDIRRVDPKNQEALISLILALTDQFRERLAGRFEDAWALLDEIEDEHDGHYYRGIVCERRGKAHHRQGHAGSGEIAHEWLLKAMDAYEKAMDVRAKGRDDALLRWNACARKINRHPRIHARPRDDASPPTFGE